MSTETAAPVVPVAAPAPVAAAPVVAAPVAAPAPVTSAEIVAPVVADGTAAPIVAAPSARPEKPKQADFGDEGGKFLSAHDKWEAEEAAWLEANPEGAKPAEVVATEAAKPAEETGDVDLSKLPAGEAPVTPQKLQELLTGDAALAAALEANPAAKGQLFQMARRNAEMEPIAKLFPTVQSAEFAQKTAGEYVGLRSKFESAVIEPAKIGEAFDAFVGQFAIIDAAGKPVMDERGNPKLAEDFNLLASHMRQLDMEGSIAEIDARIAADNYRTPEAKERDEQLKYAYEYIKGAENFEDKPDYSHLPEADRKALEAREADVKAREDALTGKKGADATAAQKAASDKGEKDFLGEHSKYISNSLDGVLKDLRDAGAHIPEWTLSYKAAGESMSPFTKNVVNGLVAIVKADPYLDAQSQKLQRAHARNPSPENLRARLDFFNGVVKDNLRNLVVNELQVGVKKDQAVAPAAPAAAPNPSIEPRGGGGAVAPVALTAEAARDMAREQLAKEIPGWENLDPSQRNSYTLTRVSKLMSR